MNTHNAEAQNPMSRPQTEPQRVKPNRPISTMRPAAMSSQEVAPPLPSPSVGRGPARLANGTFAKAIPTPQAEETMPVFDLAREIDRIYGDFVRSSAEYHRMLGELLNQVKEDETHGAFEDWVRKNCRFGLTTAWNCRKVADHWPECQEFMRHRLEANLQRAEDFSFRGFEKWLKERKNASDDTKKLARKKSPVDSKPASSKNLKAAQRMVAQVRKNFNGIRIPKPSSLDSDLMKYLDQVPYQVRFAAVRHTNEPVECPTCSGTGSTDGNSDCFQCAGSGVIVSIKLS